jgi:hypothetical protein
MLYFPLRFNITCMSCIIYYRNININEVLHVLQFVFDLSESLIGCLLWDFLYRVYVVQLDTKCSFMVEFIHNIYQLYCVLDLIGPSSGATSKAVWADWYVTIHVLLDASGRYGVVGRTQFFLQHRSGQKQLTVRESPLTKSAQAAQTLLKMDQRGPKHCRADWFVNKLNCIRILYIELDCIYIPRWYTVYTTSNTFPLYVFLGLSHFIIYWLNHPSF